MRILIFAAGGDIGGGKTHILNLARELSKNNCLRLVCFRIGEMSREAVEMGIDTVSIDVKEGWSATKKLAFDQAKSFNPDVIHCHGSKANLLGVLVKNSVDAAVMTTVHSDPRLDYMGAFFRRISYGNLNAWALKHMDFYVAVAERMRDLLTERGFDPQRIETVFNGLDFSNASTAFRSMKNESDPVIVGIAARLNPVKNIELTVNAFAKAREKDKRLILSIAGTGEEEENLRNQVKSLGIEDCVRFEGWISDIKGYFKGIDINVISSISETFPYSLLEGAYVHCPAISSNVGGISYLIEHEKTGLLFESGDVDTFADHILRLASDQSFRLQLAENLFQRAKSDFSLARMAQDQQKIYEKAVRIKHHKGRWGAVLCGAYGKGNAGDDAILRAITSSMRDIDPDMPLYVMSRKPMNTRLDYRVNSFFTFNVFELVKSLKQSSLFISGGGTLIQDVTSTRSLMFYLYTLWQARKCGAKVEMFGCGIGPIDKSFNREITAKVLNSNVDVITLRDSVSIELLEEIGVDKPEIVLAADPTVNLPEIKKADIEKAFSNAGIDPYSRKIIFCLRPWEGFEDYTPIIKAAEYAYNSCGLTPVFLPMEYPRDVAIGEKISKLLSVPSYYSKKHHSYDELRAMLSSAEIVAAMRLHALVFAASGGAPVVGISYDVKVNSFIKDSGAKRLIKLEDLSAETLIENIDLALSDGRAMGAATKAKLQELERKNSEYARMLIEEIQ